MHTVYRWTSEAKKIDEPGKYVICCRIIHLCYIICREYVLYTCKFTENCNPVSARDG